MLLCSGVTSTLKSAVTQHIYVVCLSCVSEFNLCALCPAALVCDRTGLVNSRSLHNCHIQKYIMTIWYAKVCHLLYAYTCVHVHTEATCIYVKHIPLFIWALTNTCVHTGLHSAAVIHRTFYYCKLEFFFSLCCTIEGSLFIITFKHLVFI